MAKEGQRKQWLGGGTAVSLVAAAALTLALAAPPVLAQGRSSVFDSLFGPFSGPRYAPSERPVDFTRAPAPRKAETPPAGTVLVFGDSMADWLSYGLEDALSEIPELGVMRKHRAGSGLIRYDARNEAADWAQVMPEAIAAEKPKFVVMMLGLNDRQQIRERPVTRAAGQAGAAAPPLAIVTPSGERASEADRPDQPVIMAPETRGALETHDFRTEQWAEQYANRIDAAIAALKTGGVPVFWVGMPALRGAKSTSDMLYLNDLYRTRAERAGITYIDVWDGFVDENGRYVVQGPDVDGQTRRLRVSDGVHFTKAGARKLAHYVEREIRRVLAHVGPVALPTTEPQQQTPAARPGVLSERPLAGPVVPLTVTPTGKESLIGDAGARAIVVHSSVSRALVKGEALASPAGRSDDFAWPRRGIAPFGKDPVVATTTEPLPAMRPPTVATVQPPKGDARAVTPAASRRTSGRAPAQQRQRRSSRNIELFSFGR